MAHSTAHLASPAFCPDNNELSHKITDKKETQLCSKKEGDQAAQKKRRKDIMKCEHSMRETSESWTKLDQCLRNNREQMKGEGEKKR